MHIYEYDFTPTYLYIKRHKITGLLYFGKTYQNPLRYSGSGKYWKLHKKIHGPKIETIWFCLFVEKRNLVEFASMCSEQWNIVNSEKWANLMPENGIDGSPIGPRVHTRVKRGPQTPETKALSNIRRIATREANGTKPGIKLGQKTGKTGPLSEAHKKSISIAKTNKKCGPLSEETKQRKIQTHIRNGTKIGRPSFS